MFFGISQNNDDPIEQFAYRLRKQANKCNFKHDIDEYIRDQISSKTVNEKLRLHILKHDELKLDEVLATGKALEAVFIQKQAFEKPEVVQMIEFKSDTEKRYQKFSAQFECYRCGNRNHSGADINCPARNQKCNKCNLIGHYKSKCRTRSTTRQYESSRYVNDGNQSNKK